MQTVECGIAIERLLAYVQDAHMRHEDVDAAVDHVKACPYCESRVGHLIRALRTPERDRLVCRECEERLPGYIEIVTSGHTGEARWSPVKRHLETCAHCSEVYTDLAEMIALAEGQQGVEPPGYPTPELSFLRPKRTKQQQSAGKPWHRDALGRLVIAFSDELLRSLRPRRVAFATARQKADATVQTLWRYELAEAATNLEVTLTAQQARDNPSRCSITVEVNILSRGGWPNLAGSEVTLRQGDLNLETQETDAFGKALFEEIAMEELPRLVFAIHPAPDS
jgi:hypothetical protein